MPPSATRGLQLETVAHVSLNRERGSCPTHVNVISLCSRDNCKYYVDPRVILPLLILHALRIRPPRHRQRRFRRPHAVTTADDEARYLQSQSAEHWNSHSAVYLSAMRLQAQPRVRREIDPHPPPMCNIGLRQFA